MTSSWFFLSTLNYDARSTTHQICLLTVSYTTSRWPKHVVVLYVINNIHISPPDSCVRQQIHSNPVLILMFAGEGCIAVEFSCLVPSFV